MNIDSEDVGGILILIGLILFALSINIGAFLIHPVLAGITLAITLTIIGFAIFES